MFTMQRSKTVSKQVQTYGESILLYNRFIYFRQFVYEEIFIDKPENVEWNKRYRYNIPVIHVNGKYIMKHKVDEQKLFHALRNYL